jgi:hypothetical protein
MQKLVNGQLVNLTAEEIAARLAEEATNLIAKPLRDWEHAMAETDVTMPRVVEVIYDVLTNPQKAALPTEFKDSVAAKKAKRAEKP